MIAVKLCGCGGILCLKIVFILIRQIRADRK